MEYMLIGSPDELKDMVNHYLTKKSWAFDVETLGENRLDPRRNDVAWISFACDDHNDVIPMGHPNGELLEVRYPLLKAGKVRQDKGLPEKPSDYSKDIKKAERIWEAPPSQLSRGEVFEALRPLFASDSTKVGHNVKFDVTSVQKYLPEFPSGPFFDTRTFDWVRDSSQYGKLSLADCVKRHLGKEMEKGVGADISIHSFNVVADYSALDARFTYDLYEVLRLHDKAYRSYGSLWKVFELEMQVLEVLARMETNGVRIDKAALKMLDTDFSSRIVIAESDVYINAKKKFRINSVPVKQKILYGSKSRGGQGLKPTVLTGSGQKKKDGNQRLGPVDYSTSAEALKAFEGNSVVDSLLEFQQFTKLRSTYVTPYLGGETTKYVGGKKKVVPVPSKLVRGRLHTTFVQDRAETGRLASRSPNLQNVPARSAEGMKIRELFIPSEGQIFVASDYSQIEPRIIADLADETDMIKVYKEGGDVYQAVADQVGVDRNAGKTLVLAIAYGTGASNIASNIDISTDAAFDLIRKFNAQYPRILRLKQDVIGKARRCAPMYTTTILGRRRYLPRLNAFNNADKSRSERQAFNHVIQGSAADIIKIALVKVDKALPPSAKMLLTIHDEIIVETPLGTEEEVAAIMKREMESAGEPYFEVPLVAEPITAMNWAKAK